MTIVVLTWALGITIGFASYQSLQRWLDSITVKRTVYNICEYTRTTEASEYSCKIAQQSTKTEYICKVMGTGLDFDCWVENKVRGHR